MHAETKLLDDDFDANENQRLEDLPWPVYLKEFFLSVRTNSITVIFFSILKIRPTVCFCSDSTDVFILSASTHYTTLIQGLSILLFSFINKVEFSCQ